MIRVIYFLDEINARLKIETEIDECPCDSLPLVLLNGHRSPSSPSLSLSPDHLLLQYEHVMVEELLQFLIHEIDPDLFERVSLQFKYVSSLQH